MTNNYLILDAICETPLVTLHHVHGSTTPSTAYAYTSLVFQYQTKGNSEEPHWGNTASPTASLSIGLIVIDLS
jgi:hypothetical protein